MAYKIFVSHTTKNSLVARAVTKTISDAFDGQIQLYLALEKVVGGTEWKEELKRCLTTCDALIAIVTADSIQKPWLYLEWTPFWLTDRKYYLLLGEGVDPQSLIEPMRDRQAINMADPQRIASFFLALRDDAHLTDAVPYHFVPVFLSEVANAFAAELEQTYDIYRDAKVPLPSSSLEKRRIAEYLYRIGDTAQFARVAEQIRNDEVEADMAVAAVRDGNLEVAGFLCQHIGSADELTRVAIELVEQELLDSALLRDVIGLLRQKNDAELRKLAIELIKRGLEESAAFQQVVASITNMTEVRKLALYYIDNDRWQSRWFLELIGKFESTNRTELRKLASEMIRRDVYRTEQFLAAARILVLKNTTQAIMLFEDVEKTDSAYLKTLHQELAADADRENQAIEWLLQRLPAEQPG
jgi:hypothetical protein